MSKTSAVLFAVACFLASASGSTAARHNETVTPKWRVNIRAAIGSTPLPVLFGPVQQYQGRPSTSLWFTDNNTIIATFVTRAGEGGPKLSRRDVLDPSLPVRLRAVLLDAATGKVTATTDWPSQSRHAAIVATHDGKFVAQTGHELTLYSSTPGVLKKLKLPSTKEYEWQAHPSHTGRNILFVSTGLSAGSWLWVETDTLQILHSWEDTHSAWVTISDDKIAMVTCAGIYTGEPKLQVRSLSTGWTTIAQSDRRLKPQFVGEDMLILTGNATSLIRIDGKIVFAEDGTPWKCSWSPAFVSNGGLRLVLPICREEGEIAALDISGHEVLKTILVYDLLSHEKSYAL